MTDQIFILKDYYNSLQRDYEIRLNEWSKLVSPEKSQPLSLEKINSVYEVKIP